jgi:hypothetical protein
VSALLAVAERAPDQWPQRLTLTVVVLLAALVGVLLMRRGWRRRAGRHAALPPLPVPPAPSPGAATDPPPVRGLYLGTTVAGDWLDRVVARGLGGRAAATLAVLDWGSAGVRLDRDGADPLWLPRAALTGARPARGHAGHVVGDGAVLVLGWRHGGLDLDTGFRPDSYADTAALERTVRGLLPEGVR